MSEWIFNEMERSSYLTVDTNEIITTLEKKERIVRCRDCAYYLESCEYFDGHPVCRRDGCELDGFDAVMTDPDGFCAWGEERGK